MGNLLFDQFRARIAGVDRPFIVLPAHKDAADRRLTYADMLALSGRMAAALVGCGVQPGDQPLRGGLLIAGGAVDLAGEIEAGRSGSMACSRSPLVPAR